MISLLWLFIAWKTKPKKKEKRKYLCFLQNILFPEKMSFYTKQKFYAEKKLLL